MSFDRISSDKVLGVTITNDLKWNDNINEITTKATQRCYLLRLLKRACAPPDDLILFYCCVIRSVVEYASLVFYSSLPKYLSDEVECTQKRALKIIFPDCSYSEALKRVDLPTLYARRVSLPKKLFNWISSSRNHKLSNSLPPLPIYLKSLGARNVL